MTRYEEMGKRLEEKLGKNNKQVKFYWKSYEAKKFGVCDYLYEMFKRGV